VEWKKTATKYPYCIAFYCSDFKNARKSCGCLGREWAGNGCEHLDYSGASMDMQMSKPPQALNLKWMNFTLHSWKKQVLSLRLGAAFCKDKHLPKLSHLIFNICTFTKLLCWKMISLIIVCGSSRWNPVISGKVLWCSEIRVCLWSPKILLQHINRYSGTKG
jgi:hypothetical protein